MVSSVVMVGEGNRKKVWFPSPQFEQVLALFPGRPGLSKINQDITAFADIFSHAAPCVGDDLSIFIVRSVEVDDTRACLACCDRRLHQLRPGSRHGRKGWVRCSRITESRKDNQLFHNVPHWLITEQSTATVVAMNVLRLSWWLLL